MFKKGNKLGQGGTKPGAGRPPDWLKEKCAKLVEDKKIVEFIAEVASTAKYEMRDRIKCSEILLERAYGKPLQAVMPVDDKGAYQPYSITVKIDDGGKKSRI